MKLLKKSELPKLKAAERNQEVEQGVKLSRRVDALREVAAQEEQSLEAFRTRTVKHINDDITKALETLAGLQEDVAYLRDKKAQGMIEVDRAKEAVTKREVESLRVEKEHSLWESNLRARQLEADVLLEQIKRDETTSSTLRLAAFQEARDAEAFKQDSIDMRVEASKYLDEAQTRNREVSALLETREAAVVYREHMVDAGLVANTKERQRLEDLERAVNDKYVALAEAVRHTRGH